MKNVWFIMVKEWKSFFYTPFAIVVLPVFLLLCGSYFINSLDFYLRMAMPDDASAVVQGLNVNQHLLMPFFNSLLNVFVFIIPLVGMRTFAEEKKTATYELLVSYPITPMQILMGKYLGLLSTMLFLLALSAIYPAFVMVMGHPTVAMIGTTYLGYGLLIILFSAVGLWASLLTENQFIAAVVTYAVYFLSFLFAYLTFIAPAPLDRIFANFLVVAHLESFRQGLIYQGDVVVFLVCTVLFLTLAYDQLRRHYTR